MKKIVLSLLALGLVMGVNAQTKKKKPVKKKAKQEVASKKAEKVKIAKKDSLGNIKFNKTTHDFGKIPQGIPVTYTFKFANANPSAVTVTNARPSCGCTVPSWSKEPIPSGGTGTVTATFNAAATGHFRKTITVTTNLGQVTLIITGVVQAKPAEPAPSPIKIGG